jgi:molybdenum cofactor biosynthesis protein MoaC/molybdopterin converting factor subunit 1
VEPPAVLSEREMLFEVRLFAVLRERTGADRLQLRLPAGATVADALAALARDQRLGGILAGRGVVMAVNREYAGEGTELHEHDELALIPPLSGGSSDAGAGDRATLTRGDARTPRAAAATPPLHVVLTREPLSRERARAAVADARAGAIVSFEGVTRDVPQLDYDAYAEMAREHLQRILVDVAARHAVLAAAVEHRLGTVALGEPSVIVCVSAAHRAEAFAGAREVIDAIKAQVPIWKREPDGWVAGERPAALTHLDRHGSARMVDVGGKPESARVARARARVRMSRRAARAVRTGDGPKGEVLAVARVAGIQAAKQTAQLIPLAHPLALDLVDVRARVDVEDGVVELLGEARTVARTGVEMEAMTACAVAALTVYDMVKGLERGVSIEQVTLLEKRGGRSDYRAAEA